MGGSGPGEGTRDWVKGLPGPGSRLTRPVPCSFQLPFHACGRIRGQVPLAGRRGHERRRGFLPHLHDSKSNRDPNETRPCLGAGGTPHVRYLCATAPLGGRRSASRENCVYPSSSLSPAAGFSEFWFLSRTLQLQPLPLLAIGKKGKKKKSRELPRESALVSSREICERPSCSCP